MIEGEQKFHVITANDLRSGEIVYMIAGDGMPRWTGDIHDATVFTEDEREAMLAQALEAARANAIIDAYAIEITGNHEPLSMREIVRARRQPTMRYGRDALLPDEPDFVI